jgi:hypothetical protein
MKFLKATERFNADALNYIISNYETLIKDIDDYKSSKTHLQKYLDNSYNGKINVKYRQADYGGRFNSIKSLSLQNLKRCIRHTISKDYYNDIDIVNAHPIILLYLCKENGFDCPNLEQYVNNREDILKQTGLDRDTAKEQYLVLTNSDEDYFECKTLHQANYKIEMRRLHNLFVNKDILTFNKLQEERIKNGKKGNHKASYVNRLLCDMENNILMAMYKFYGKPSDCVLCFDGIMIDKSIDTRLSECEKYIKDNIGIDIQLKQKPMDNGLQLPKKLPKHSYYKLDYYEDVYKLQDKVFCREIIEKWFDNVVALRDIGGEFDYILKTNKGYVLTKSSSFNRRMSLIKCKIINDDYDEYYHKENPTSKELKCKKYIATDLGNGKNGFLNLYFSKLKNYNNLDYVPYLQQKGNSVDAHTFNMFDRYTYDNDKPCNPNVFTNSNLFRLLKENFFNNDMKGFEYFLDYIADILQDPTGTLAKFLRKLFDDKNIAVINNVDLYFESRFNSDTSSKLIKIFEELGECGSAFKHHNRLKAEITSDTNRVENKGFEAYNTINCARYIFFGNYEGGTRVPNNDRRYNLWYINNHRANDLKFFEQIHKDIDNDFYMRSAFEFFAKRTYNKLKIMVAYENDFKREQKLDQLPLPIKFIMSYVESSYKKIEDINDKAIARNVYDAYDMWCSSEGYTGKTAGKAHILRKHLKKLGLEPTTQKVGKTTKRCFLINTLKLQNNLRKFLQNDNYTFSFE